MFVAWLKTPGGSWRAIGEGPRQDCVDLLAVKASAYRRCETTVLREGRQPGGRAPPTPLFSLMASGQGQPA
jgi:hypothetical protein